MGITQKGRRAAALSLAGLAAITAIGSIGFFAYPFTDFRAARTQRSLRETFATASLKSAYRGRNRPRFTPLTRIITPTMGTDAVVVEGTSTKALNTGASDTKHMAARAKLMKSEPLA